jgi:hypothetical protein
MLLKRLTEGVSIFRFSLEWMLGMILTNLRRKLWKISEIAR